MTKRYINNILCRGGNSRYQFNSSTRELAHADDVCIGCYYKVEIYDRAENRTEFGVGNRPYQAAQRALEKLGMTFQ